MIPKIIHYVWLSGDEKPQLIKDCIQSWRDKLIGYEIREWKMSDVDNIDSAFLKEAIKSRKWAFATDFLRYYIIYKYGGIYMDSDIYVFRDFEPLLFSKGFTSFEASGILSTEKKKPTVDFGLEAAVFGAEKGSVWIKNILNYYSDLTFKNDPKFLLSIIAPKVMWNQTIPFGLRRVYSFQKLNDDIIIYPADTLSCIADFRMYKTSPNNYKIIGDLNPLKFACHMCNNSWGWQRPLSTKEKFKNLLIRLMGKDNAIKLKKWAKNCFK